MTTLEQRIYQSEISSEISTIFCELIFGLVSLVSPKQLHKQSLGTTNFVLYFPTTAVTLVKKSNF